ncbi:hypothetical protein RB195_000359 [Necator americanus]|uniref:Uncharacterized protein n=1 Tax=Necator americanus TaxID=51031 RepID=A0ABR1D998_NECAM
MALLTFDERSKASVIRLARLLAAFYLGFPLFVPKNGTSYPSLFIWSQMEKDECPPDCLPLNRDEFGRDLPPEYVPRTPVVLFVNCGSILEAILFCDYFSDVRSSLMIRLFADEVCRLNLTTSFLEELRTKQLRTQVENIIVNTSTSAPCAALGHRYVQSLLEIEIFYDTRDLHEMQMFVVSQLELLFAQLPLRVQDLSVLPRPPVYCYQSHRDGSLESKIHSTMHCYMQILFISLQKTNRMNLEINRINELINDEATTAPSPSLLIQALLLVLRTTYRDMFSMAVMENRADLSLIAAKYNAVVAAVDCDEGNIHLKSWLALASPEDLEHVSRFLTFLSEGFPEKNDLPPLRSPTRSLWRAAMLPKECKVPKRTDWLSGVTISAHKVGKFTYDKMAFAATEWTTPLIHDPSLIPMLLHLVPADFCSPSSTVSQRSCMSARPTFTSAFNEPTTERIFSPKRDVVALYAERGRRLMEKNGSWPTKTAYSAQLRSIREKLKRNISIQRNLKEDINDERSFVESLPSSRNFEDGTGFWGRSEFSARVKTDKLRSDKFLEHSAEEITRDLRTLSTKMNKIQSSNKLWEQDIMDGNSSVTGFPETKQPPEAVESSSERSVDEEEVEDLPLNYEQTAPSNNPLPKMEKLDFTLLSPTVNVGRQGVSKELSEKPPSRTLVTHPEWMRLISLEEVNSTKPLLLQYSPRKEKNSRAETSTQTGVFQRDLSEKGCQTKEEERVPPDSGFLDTMDRSPRKKMEIIQSMSMKSIQEMLSQM